MPVNNRPQQPRTVSRLSTALAALRQQEEQEHLLGGDDEEERLGPRGPDESDPPEEIFATDPHKDLPVYRTIHRYATARLLCELQLTPAAESGDWFLQA